MQYHPPITDLDVIDGLSIWYLKFFGFLKVINDYRITGKRNLFLKCKFISMFLISSPYVVCHGISYFVIDVDIQKAIILNLHFLPAIITLCRSLVFWFCIGNICKLFNLTRKDFLHIPENKMAETRKIYRKITKSGNILCMLAFVADSVVIFTLIAIPGAPIDYILYHTGSISNVKTGKKKLFSSWYPLPMAETPYYEIIFAYEFAVSIFLGTICVPLYICLFYQVLVALHAQFVALGHHVSTLHIDSIRSQRKMNTHQQGDSGICEDMYRILLDHQKLLSYANELRSVYNPMVTLQLGLSITLTIVSLLQYYIGEMGDLVFKIKGLEFLIFQSIELSMFCFGSSSIETASSDLHFAIYNSDWYKADANFRKAAQMMMVRSKKGVTLTAVKMYPVNLETLMSIMQFTYSATALTTGMMEK